MLAVLRFSDKIVVATYSTSREVTKEGIRECVAGNATMTQGRRYTSQVFLETSFTILYSTADCTGIERTYDTVRFL